MPFIEFTGRNVEQAVESACSKLNIPKEKLQHDVVSFGASGIFGLVGVKKARIRVAVSEPSENTTVRTPAAAPSSSADSQIPDVFEKEPSSSPEAAQPNVLDDSAERGRQVLDRLVNFLAPGADISVEIVADRILYTVKGGNPALLIGKKGQTIESIQYLLKKVINKSQENKIQVLIDIEGYFSKRHETLQKQALQLAEKACCNGKSVFSGKLSPQDRKIIHMALKDDERVKTQSKGAGYLRNIIVSPQKPSLP